MRVVPSEHTLKRISLVLYFLKDMKLARIAHHLRLAAQKPETIVELFTLGNRHAHICFAADIHILSCSKSQDMRPVTAILLVEYYRLRGHRRDH
ncbi:MAG: hypothetical protein WBR10_18785 [Candidatus Acidiferrum sp.]